MTDPLEIGIGLAGTIFGAGAAWAALRASVKATRIDVTTALQQAQSAHDRLSVEQNRSTAQDGKLNLYNERIGTLQRDVGELRGAVFKSRLESGQNIPAVPRPNPRDERRDDTDPPPMRPRAPSRRDG